MNRVHEKFPGSGGRPQVASPPLHTRREVLQPLARGHLEPSRRAERGDLASPGACRRRRRGPDRPQATSARVGTRSPGRLRRPHGSPYLAATRMGRSSVRVPRRARRNVSAARAPAARPRERRDPRGGASRAESAKASRRTHRATDRLRHRSPGQPFASAGEGRARIGPGRVLGAERRCRCGCARRWLPVAAHDRRSPRRRAQGRAESSASRLAAGHRRRCCVWCLLGARTPLPAAGRACTWPSPRATPATRPLWAASRAARRGVRRAGARSRARRSTRARMGSGSLGGPRSRPRRRDHRAPDGAGRLGASAAAMPARPGAGPRAQDARVVRLTTALLPRLPSCLTRGTLREPGSRKLPNLALAPALRHTAAKEWT